MQNKKLMLTMGVLVLFAGVAAFLAGKFINSGASPLDQFGLAENGNVTSISMEILPAEELPKGRPEITGLFVERQDNTIIVQSISKFAAQGGDVAASSGSSPELNMGPEVEVVISNETIIYRDTTQPPSGDDSKVQQTVEEATLDDLNSHSIVMVWGRKSGDRMIAEVLMYTATLQ